MAKRTKDESTEPESFDAVKAALDAALGKPKRERGGVACYPAPDAKRAREWIARVRAAGGSAGLRVENIKYTDFVIRLDRVPRNPWVHAKRLAKCVMMGDEAKIAASLRKRRWHTGS